MSYFNCIKELSGENSPSLSHGCSVRDTEILPLTESISVSKSTRTGEGQDMFGYVTEQSILPSVIALSPVAQEQLAFGGVAVGTIAGIILLLREVRLLVKACKGQ